MFDFVSTITAALIGSIIGSVGAVLMDHWLSGRSERLHKREILIQRYLFQFQDAIEMLYFRLNNLAHEGGQSVKTEEYFKESTLYALGRVLVIERIFALEAVYPQLDSIYPGLGKALKKQRIDHQLPDYFYRYDRLSLAEAVIMREGDSFRASTFLEFRKRYEAKDAWEQKWLEPASEAIRTLPLERMEKMLAILKLKAKLIADKTGIDCTIVNRSITSQQQKVAIPS